MAINKVVYGNTALIDLTSDTVEASDVAQGKTFHLRSGEQATGTALGGTSIYDGDDSTGDLYNELFLGDIASGVDAVKVAFDMDLLWTNSDPSATFPAQTISLDLSDYKAVLISVYTATTLTSSVKNNFVVKGETTEIQPPIYNGSLRSRTVTVSDSGISFSRGIFWNSYNNASSAQTQDVQAIPYKIYGIR